MTLFLVLMATVEHYIKYPEERHHPICLLFTPDEEIGRGPEHFDAKRFGAAYAYTLDGAEPDIIEDENFNAAHVDVFASPIALLFRVIGWGFVRNIVHTASIILLLLNPNKEVAEGEGAHDEDPHNQKGVLQILFALEKVDRAETSVDGEARDEGAEGNELLQIKIGDQDRRGTVGDETDQDRIKRREVVIAAQESRDLILANPKDDEPKDKGDHIGIGEDLKRMNKRVDQMLVPRPFPFDLVAATADMGRAFAMFESL